MQNSALIIAAQPATAKPERQCYECGRGIGKAQDELAVTLADIQYRLDLNTLDPQATRILWVMPG